MGFNRQFMIIAFFGLLTFYMVFNLESAVNVLEDRVNELIETGEVNATVLVGYTNKIVEAKNYEVIFILIYAFTVLMVFVLSNLQVIVGMRDFLREIDMRIRVLEESMTRRSDEK